MISQIDVGRLGYAAISSWMEMSLTSCLERREGMNVGVELLDSFMSARQLVYFTVSRGACVSGFPTLILGPGADETDVAIARGFQTIATVLPAIAGQLTAAA